MELPPTDMDTMLSFVFLDTNVVYQKPKSPNQTVRTFLLARQDSERVIE